MKFPDHAFGIVLRIVLLWGLGFAMGYGAFALRAKPKPCHESVATVEPGWAHCPDGTIAVYTDARVVICRCPEGPKP